MVRRAYRQRSLVEVLLPDSDKLWDPALRRIDTLLDDDVLTDRIADALARRHPQSQRRGRYGTPATVVLRMLVLKHLNDWSFDECEREVRGSLVYRAFCRIDGERVPDAKTLIRLTHLLDGAVLKDVLARLVELGRRQRVIRGRRRRRDEHPSSDGRHAAGRRSAGGHPHSAASRAQGSQSNTQRRPPRLRTCSA